MTVRETGSDAQRADAPARALAFGCCSAFACLLFALGSGFDLDPFDSAELALVAVTRGLGHPPGQPLHTLVGWIVTRGPWPPLVALALLSIVPMGVALAATAVAECSNERRSTRRWSAAAVAVAAACAVSTVRDVSARVEVYALAASLSVASLLVSQRRTARYDGLAGALLGLSACANPVVAVQGIVSGWLAARGGRRWAWGRWALGGLVGLFPYVYAALVAGRETQTLVWSAPHDIRSWIALLTARDFQRNVAVSPAGWCLHVVDALVHFTRTGAIPIVVLGAFGLAQRDPEGRRSPLLVAGAFSLVVGLALIGANEPFLARNPDYGGYLLVPVALACGGIARLVRLRTRATWPSVVALGVLTALAVVGALAARPARVVRDLARRQLERCPPSALLVLESDHLLFPVLYLQRVESVRPDVVVLNVGWSSSRWAWRYVQQHDPRLRVDLTPDLGGRRRLIEALRSRGPGRAVLAESLAVLRGAAEGAVCLRGVTWASAEACGDARLEADRTLDELRRFRTRSRARSWDRSIVDVTALSLASTALTLGCSGMAESILAAASDRTVSPGRRCGSPPQAPGSTIGLLEVEDRDVDAALVRITAAARP